MKKQVADETKIFEKGILIKIDTSMWGGVKKIDKKTAIEALGSDYAKAQKYLVDPKSLKPIASIRNAARAYVMARSLPFPIAGLDLIPQSLVERVDERLEMFQEDFEAACFEFYQEYNYLSRVAADVLGTLYNSDDYPKDIRSRFSFDWKFVMLSAPGETSLIDPKIVAREQKKFMNMMEDTRIMAVTALREEFKDMVTRAVERLTPDETGSPKVFHKSTMSENFITFFETFKDRNIFEDKELAKIIVEAEGIVKGIDIDTLRNNEDFRKEIKTEMSKVAAMIDTCIKDAPTRKLKLN